MERFFEKDKIILTGNPVRQGLRPNITSAVKDAIRSFGLDPSKKTILIVGGSLGARTINNCVMEGLDKIKTIRRAVYLANRKNIYRRSTRRSSPSR